jgi:hypothetical protein
MTTLSATTVQTPHPTLRPYFMSCSLMDAGPMAMATVAWERRERAARLTAEQESSKESFNEWHSSLDEAFAAFDKRQAS